MHGFEEPALGCQPAPFLLNVHPPAAPLPQAMAATAPPLRRTAQVGLASWCDQKGVVQQQRLTTYVSLHGKEDERTCVWSRKVRPPHERKGIHPPDAPTPTGGASAYGSSYSRGAGAGGAAGPSRPSASAAGAGGRAAGGRAGASAAGGGGGGSRAGAAGSGSRSGWYAPQVKPRALEDAATAFTVHAE